MLILVVAAMRLGLMPGPMDVWGKPDVSPQGFTGDVRQPPTAGTWLAIGTYTTYKGYDGRAVGEKIERRWITTKDCTPGACSYSITRELENSPSTTAPLTLRPDGWHAQFPDVVLRCRWGRTWAARATFVFRFTDAGRHLEAHEVRSSHARGCGYAVARVDWTAGVAYEGADAPAGGPLPSDIDGPTTQARAVAGSVRLAADRHVRRIVLRISAARGQRVRLPASAGYTSCRPGGEGRSRAAFVCRVAILAKTGLFGVRILVTKFDGRCWEGLDDLWEEPGRGEFPFADSKLQRRLAAKPLRGCVAQPSVRRPDASPPAAPPPDSSRPSSQLPRA